MTVEIRTQAIAPERQTFAHLARRFGNKPSSRYQEATYDLQSTENRHYKPLWDPEHDIYDPRRTAVTMGDWYALKDPRHYYYASYTAARAKAQEALDAQMQFADQRGLLRELPAEAREAIVFCLVPLRHYEWGANTNCCHVAAYSWGAAISQAAMMATMDRLGMAQHLSRIGLLTDGGSGASLAAAKTHWVDHPAWQGMRRAMETMFVTRDWFELLVAQALVADALVYPLAYGHFDRWMGRRHGPALPALLDFLVRWQDESARWVDAVVKTAAADNADNRRLLSAWAAHWRAVWREALQPWAEAAMPGEGPAALAAVDELLGQRLARLGLAD